MPFPNAEAITSLPVLIDIEMERTRGLGNIALYTLVHLDDSEAFLTAVASDDDMPDSMEDSLRFPPDYDFSGQTLADVVKYHQNLAPDSSRRDDFDYSIFIVAVHEDYVKHGVLIVELVNENYSDIEAVPMIARSPLQSDLPEYADTVTAFSWCVNLQIANMDMGDLLDQEESINWPAPLPGLEDVRASLKTSAEDQKQRAQERYDLLPTRHERYSLHHVADADRDTGTMKFDIEPDVHYKTCADREDKIATVRGDFLDKSLTDEQKLDLVRRHHPEACMEPEDSATSFSASWRRHKFWMFIFDRTVASGEGVALVKVRWDGVTEGKSKEELQAIMPELEIVERCQVQNALRRMDEISEFKGTAAE